MSYRPRFAFSGLSAACGLMLGCSGAAVEATTSPVSAEPETHVASASASAVAEVVLPKAESPFIAVTNLPPGATVYGVKGALLVGVGGSIDPKNVGKPADEQGMPGIAFGVIENDQLKMHDELFYTLPNYGGLLDVGGSWPGKLDYFAVGTTGRTNVEIAGGEWLVGRSYVGSAQVGDTTYVVDRLLPMNYGPSAELRVMRGKKTTARKLTPLIDQKGFIAALEKSRGEKLSSWEIAEIPTTEVHPEALAGTGDGTLIAMGTRTSGVRALEIWPLDSDKSRIENLPDDLGDQLVGGRGSDAWIYGKGKLHHWDGKSCAPVSGAPNFGVLVVDRASVVWGIDDASVLYRGGLGGFQPVPLPDQAKANQVLAADDGGVWVVSGDALLRSKKATDAESKVVIHPQTAKPRPHPAGGNDCTDNVVVLYGFTKVTPDDYDFPLTRKALKGHTEFKGVKFAVTRDKGEKYFVAIPQSFHEGMDVAALIKKEIPTAKPAVVCADPEILREVKIDLSSGEVIK